MLHANQIQKLFASVGSIGLLALISSAAHAESSPAPMKNGASQVSVTLTADAGGACTLDHATAVAGPMSWPQ